MLLRDTIFACVKALLDAQAGAAFPAPVADMPERTDDWRLRGDGLCDVLMLSDDGEAPRELDRLYGADAVQIEALVMIEAIYTVGGVEGSWDTRRAARSAALFGITQIVLADRRLGGLAGNVTVATPETDQDSTTAGSESSARLVISILVCGPEGTI